MLTTNFMCHKYRNLFLEESKMQNGENFHQHFHIAHGFFRDFCNDLFLYVFEQTHSATNISELFDDVLIHIFSMLSFKERVAIERVCQRWRKVVQATWVSMKSLSFHNFFKRFGGKILVHNFLSVIFYSLALIGLSYCFCTDYLSVCLSICL